MPVVVITTEPMFHKPGPHVDMLSREGFEIRYPSQAVLTTESETIDALAGLPAVIAGGELYTEAVFAALPELRVVSRYGVGFDRVDVEAATRHGVVVTITPQGNHASVAEHAMALLLAVTRSIVRNDVDARRGVWLKEPLMPLRGKTLGIIGYGRVGRSVATRAAAFGLEVLAYDKYVPDTAFDGAERVTLDDLLARSGIVSLHAPSNDETRGMIDQSFLSRMKRGCILINTARGELVVEDDLIAALRSGQVAGAGLDVLCAEPPPDDHALFTLDNVVISPHVAANDIQALDDMGVEAAQNVIDLARGEWPGHAVLNEEVKARWSWDA